MLRLLLRHGNFVMGFPGFTFRRQDWQRKGGISSRYRIGADYDFLTWLCTQGPAVFLPKIQYLRREHAANLCNDRFPMLHDLAAVRARRLRERRDLLGDPGLRAALCRWYREFAYWSRQTGHYRIAAKASLLGARTFGDWPHHALALLKLLPHWLLTATRLRRPAAAPQDL
jgi:hypothetical protein